MAPRDCPPPCGFDVDGVQPHPQPLPQPAIGPGAYWWRQHLAGLLANLASLGVGISIGWTAQALPVLRGEEPGSPLRLSLQESSWVGALVPLGGLVGALPAGLLADRLGRKRALLVETVPFIAGWLLILFAHDKLWLLYAGRFLNGLGVGANSVLVAIYCEEIAEVRTRGMIGSYLDLVVTVGMLWVYVLGALLPYFWSTAASLLPPLLLLVTFSWMPESPVFLVSRGRMEEARRSLTWLRGPYVDVQPELNALDYSVKKSNESQQRWVFFGGLCSLPRIDRTTAKALAIVLGIMFFAQANGVNVFVFYSTDVFKEADTDLSPQMATILMGVVHVVGTFFPTLTVDRIGRRFLLSATFFAMGLCLVVLSMYFHFDSKDHDMSSWRWVPLLALVVYMFLISAGPGPLSWFMMAEILPVAAKGWGSALSVCFSRTLVVLVIKEFPPIVKWLGEDVTYGIFSLMCFLGIAFTCFCVPETKGKTRDEIQDELRNKKKVINRDIIL